MSEKQKNYTGFAGHQLIGSGALEDVALKAKERLDRDESSQILIFDDETGEPIHPDFRGTREQFLEKLAKKMARAAGGSEEAEEPRRSGPGRPKLGVVSREVSLLPRHWEWLNEQPGGASVTLRKLVEEAKRASQGTDRARRSWEAAYKFMQAMAGDFPGFEEASRAFFAKSHERFDAQIQTWPKDVRNHLRKLVAIAIRDEKATAS
ncbi:DUF2239 family protein [Archangium violaceum]|uniref:DUF2239 family protein n=1 Tax=Archangium violaceum TaxID=83451 RepID=UPI00193C7E57|nr:DUF2239 family protein [Archangium violaceum]QRK06449.1 DUF2239 family protein [Archangium violaceum]